MPQVGFARDAGAKKVYFTSAAPPIRYPNIYGIDIPTRSELVAYERDEADVARHIGCEWVVYQDLDDLVDSVASFATDERPLPRFDTSCFSGEYVTGERIGDAYFERLHEKRNDDAKQAKEAKTPMKSGYNKNKGDMSPMKDEPLGQSSHDGCEPINNAQA